MAEVRPTGSADVTVQAPPAEAMATAPAPTTSIEQGVAAGTLTRTVVWSKNPDAWFAEVRDGDGNPLGVELGLDADNVYLDLRDLLGPP